METVIRVENVSKTFRIRRDKSLKERLIRSKDSKKHESKFDALRDINLTIGSGETVGLIGANGSGKSTLLKTIGGIIKPTTGSVLYKGRLAALLELGAGFHPDLTGRENVFLNAALLGLTPEEISAQFEDIVEFSGIRDFIDSQVKFYSSGMYVRLAFAVAVHANPDILIVDEVLAVGDEPFQQKCLDRIRRFQAEGKTIVLVTHSLETVADMCTRAVVMESGSVVFDGAPSEGIHHLRQGFEARRREEVMPGASGATISNVKVLDANAREVHGFNSGETIVLSCAIESRAPILNWAVGFGIESAAGQLAYGTNTRLLGKTFDVLDSPTVLTFELSNSHMAPGQYFVHFSFDSLQAGEVFRINRAATFSIKGEISHEGVVELDCQIIAK